MLGLVTLALMALVGVVALSSALPLSLLVPSLLVVATITLVALGLPRLLTLLARRWGQGKTGKVLSVSALALAEALNGPLARNRVRLETLGASLLYQLVSLSILAVVVPQPSVEHVLGIYVGVPLALIAAMVPITIGGVGLRESLFVVVLAPFGFTREQAFALALVWLGSSLIAALAGALVLATERRAHVAT
jgi:glycosyltransferase 2 family protein